MNLNHLFLFLSLGRVLFTLFFQLNFDYPDEYWQGPQVAYYLYHNYGYLTWQYTMEQPIRNVVYQYYLTIGYYLMDFIKVTDKNWIQIAPKIMQVFVAIAADFYFIRIVKQMYGRRATIAGMLFLLSNWFYLSMMQRTFINSFQCALFLIGYYFWMIRNQNYVKYDLLHRVIVTLGYITRPTSIIPWAIIWPYELVTLNNKKYIRFIFKNLLNIILMVCASVGVGTLFYNKLSYTEYNFIKYNIVLKWSHLYGVHNFCFYLYASLPFIFGPYLMLFLYAIYKRIIVENQFVLFLKVKFGFKISEENKQKLKNNENNFNETVKFWEMFFFTIAIIVILSFTKHKQHRFLLLIVPFILCLSLDGMLQKDKKSYLKVKDEEEEEKEENEEKLEKQKKIEKEKGEGMKKKTPFIVKILLFSIVIWNLVMLGTIAFFGKKGGNQILRIIRDKIDNKNSTQPPTVVFLCEPHILPAFSTFQHKVNLKLIDTSPQAKIEKNFDETKELQISPQKLFNQMANSQKDPQFVVVQYRYLGQVPTIRPNYRFLLEKGYQIVRVARNVLFWEEYFGEWDGFILLQKQ